MRLRKIGTRLVWGKRNKDWDGAVKRYEAGEVTLQEVGDEFEIGRGAVRGKFRRMGVDTSKATRCWVERACVYCGDIIKKRRKQARGVTNHFCDRLCYGMWLRHDSGARYNPTRHGQRVGRLKVEREYGFTLPEGSVVHHINGNCFDNALENLMLFEGNGDHVRWHRDCREGIEPLWRGDYIKEGA